MMSGTIGQVTIPLSQISVAISAAISTALSGVTMSHCQITLLICNVGANCPRPGSTPKSSTLYASAPPFPINHVREKDTLLVSSSQAASSASQRSKEASHHSGDQYEAE